MARPAEFVVAVAAASRELPLVAKCTSIPGRAGVTVAATAVRALPLAATTSGVSVSFIEVSASGAPATARTPRPGQAHPAAPTSSAATVHRIRIPDPASLRSPPPGRPRPAAEA